MITSYYRNSTFITIILLLCTSCLQLGSICFILPTFLYMEYCAYVLTSLLCFAHFLKVLDRLVVVPLLLYKFKVYIISCISLHFLILATTFELSQILEYTTILNITQLTFSLSFLIPSKICSTCFKNKSLFFSEFIALLCTYSIIHTLKYNGNTRTYQSYHEFDLGFQTAKMNKTVKNIT